MAGGQAPGTALSLTAAQTACDGCGRWVKGGDGRPRNVTRVGRDSKEIMGDHMRSHEVMRGRGRSREVAGGRGRSREVAPRRSRPDRRRGGPPRSGRRGRERARTRRARAAPPRRERGPARKGLEGVRRGQKGSEGVRSGEDEALQEAISRSQKESAIGVSWNQKESEAMGS